MRQDMRRAHFKPVFDFSEFWGRNCFIIVNDERPTFCRNFYMHTIKVVGTSNFYFHYSNQRLVFSSKKSFQFSKTFKGKKNF